MASEESDLAIGSITDNTITDASPDSYVDLRYKAHRHPDYIRVSARNRHPDKSIQAYFYIMTEKGGRFVPDKDQNTIEACLKPSEKTVVYFAEKKYNPRLFLYYAAFAD